MPPHLFGGLAADFGRRSGGAADKDLISGDPFWGPSKGPSKGL